MPVMTRTLGMANDNGANSMYCMSTQDLGDSRNIFNRRTSRARGLLYYRLLQQAVSSSPVSYNELVHGKNCFNESAQPTSEVDTPFSYFSYQFDEGS